LGYTRRGLLEGYAKVADPIVSERKAEAAGQFSLFGGGERAVEQLDESVLAGPEFDKTELLRLEKEMLGQFVTDHPLLAIKDRLAAQTTLELSEVTGLGDGDVVTVAGIVGAVARKYTKRGDPYALLRLEDLTGGVSVVAFPSTFDRVADLIAQDRVLVVKGRADLRGRELQLVALEVAEPDLSGPGEPPPIRGGSAGEILVVDVSRSGCTPGLLRRLKGLLSLYPGAVPVSVQLVEEGGGDGMRLRLGDEFRVDGSGSLTSELARLFGPDAVRLVPNEPAGAGNGAGPKAPDPTGPGPNGARVASVP
jgi:DNA polymerase III subunit alpha